MQHDKKYIEALKLSTQVWIWLYKNPGKRKEDSPYWDELIEMPGNCPMCDYCFQKAFIEDCSNCILFIKKLCAYRTKDFLLYYKWKRASINFRKYETTEKESKDKCKLAAARIASVLRREYERVTGDKKSFRNN